MADLFGSLGGLMKGLTSIMPQNDPATQLLKLQGEVSDLKKQEGDLYGEIGKRAIEQHGLESFGDLADRLKLTQTNLAVAEQKLAAAKAEAEAKEKAAEAARAERTCPQCGHENPEGTRFCQACGGKLGMAGTGCPGCGTVNAPGVKFCSGCGTRLIEEESGFCSGCGAPLVPGSRFCSRCGQQQG
ncbi:MAG: zinc ribbon domain-containing protein [Clostridia bacterium]|nr:zinc ribbon domain-containing protein [Clostridia bacterium]